MEASNKDKYFLVNIFMKILIAGDSWGAGVWVNTDQPYLHKKRIHNGSEFFLKEYGHDVNNISTPGGSNNQTLSLLETINLGKYELIILFYTNPLRDLYQPNKLLKHLNFADRTVSQHLLESIHDELSKDFLNNLNLLNNKIYLLGGHSKVNFKNITYTNLKVLIPSIREWFYPNYVQEHYSGIYQDGGWFKHSTHKNLADKLDLELLDAISNYKFKTDEMIRNQKKYFYPDDYHLNIEGHKKLSDHIQDQIINNILP